MTHENNLLEKLCVSRFRNKSSQLPVSSFQRLNNAAVFSWVAGVKLRANLEVFFMKFWKTAALATGIVAAAGLGAALTPAVHGQTRAPRMVTPRAAEVFWSGGGSRLGVSITDVSADDARGKVTREF